MTTTHSDARAQLPGSAHALPAAGHPSTTSPSRAVAARRRRRSPPPHPPSYRQLEAPWPSAIPGAAPTWLAREPGSLAAWGDSSWRPPRRSLSGRRFGHRHALHSASDPLHGPCLARPGRPAGQGMRALLRRHKCSRSRRCGRASRRADRHQSSAVGSSSEKSDFLRFSGAGAGAAGPLPTFFAPLAAGPASAGAAVNEFTGFGRASPW